MSMKKNPFLLLFLLLFFGISAVAQNPNEFYFVNALKSSSKSEVTKVIQDDITGNFVLAGTYSGDLHLNPQRTSLFTHTTGTSTSITASFIALYDETGKYLWSMSVNPSRNRRYERHIFC